LDRGRDEEMFGSIAAAIINVRTTAKHQSVVDVERVFPVSAAGDGPVTRLRQEWTFAEYGRLLEPRLRGLMERENEPRVMPHVLRAWDLDPAGDGVEPGGQVEPVIVPHLFRKCQAVACHFLMRKPGFDPDSKLWLRHGVSEGRLLGLYVARERPELCLGMKIESGAAADHTGWSDWTQFFTQLTQMAGRPGHFGEPTGNTLADFCGVILEVQMWGNVIPRPAEMATISDAIGRITETDDPPPTPLHAFGRAVHTAFQLGLVARDADPVYARQLWDSQPHDDLKNGYGQRILLDAAQKWPDPS
jgi:hypothetical protein